MIIGITPPEPRPDEAARIAALLEAGCRYVHVRFPRLEAASVERIVRSVPEHLRHRLTLHSCFTDPVAQLVGGIHLNSRCGIVPAGWRGRVSCSCHSVGEVVRRYAAMPQLDYATLSPVFDSVSKAGYGPQLSIAALADELAALPGRFNIVALGGITPATLPLLPRTIFAGAAVLGYFSQQPDATAMPDAFKKLTNN